MNYTKDGFLSMIQMAYDSCRQRKNSDEIEVASVIKQAGGNKENKEVILNLFQCTSYEELLTKTGLFEVYRPEGKTHLVMRRKIMQDKTTEEISKMAETPNIHTRIKTLRDALTEGLYEKEEAVRLALLTAIAGESIFFLGAPGCAKSMIARRIVNAFKTDGADGGANNDVQNVQYFEYLMNQFSTPEDIFGPISLKALNGEGKSGKEEYKRITEKMLPEADIAFLDEIWKASPAIQNTLLTIINEKKFHNGNEIVSVPLKALLAASNELPARSRGLEALYDRFILRLPVNFIQSESTFFEMISQPSSPEFELSDETRAFQITNDELKEWKGKIDEVRLSAEARNVISAIRKELTAENAKLSEEEKKNGELFEVGDRRWKKIAHILKASAFLNGRNEVDLMDCQLIEYCIWNTEAQQEKAKAIVEKCIQQNGLDCDTAIEDIEEQIKNYSNKITKTFYEPEYIDVDGDAITAKINGEECQEIKTNDGNTFYIGNRYFYTSKQGDNQMMCSNVIMNNDEVEWETEIKDYNYRRKTVRYSGHVQMTMTRRQSGKFLKNSLFQNKIAFEASQNKFDEEYYYAIQKYITTEIQKLDTFVAEKSMPYKANLFAQQECCDVIMRAIVKAKEDLQDAQVDLDKERSRYKNET